MKTNLQVLNEISAKLGGESDAVVITEALNNIANALGDTEPDRIKTISESLEDILEYANGGSGGLDNMLAVNYYADSIDGVSCDVDYDTLNAALSDGKGILAFLRMDSTYASMFGIDPSYVVPSCYVFVEDEGIRIRFSIELSGEGGTYTTFRGVVMHSEDGINVGIW